jgi:hypothetical protein
MKRFVLGLMGTAFASIATIAVLSPATATGATANTVVKWDTQAIVTMSLTPNYYTGFGAVKAVFGTQPAAVPGPHAGPAVGQGDVDFGSVLSGTDYLYKYAAEVNVITNDPSGFKLYGEGAADFAQNGGAGSAPLSSTLFYTTSGATSDSNNGFTPGLPFQQTTGGVVTGATYAGPGTINYGGIFPGSPVASSIAATGTFYYDYLLKVPSSITTGGDYYVWIVYTVVGS